MVTGMVGRVLEQSWSPSAEASPLLLYSHVKGVSVPSSTQPHQSGSSAHFIRSSYRSRNINDQNSYTSLYIRLLLANVACHHGHDIGARESFQYIRWLPESDNFQLIAACEDMLGKQKCSSNITPLILTNLQPAGILINSLSRTLRCISTMRF